MQLGLGSRIKLCSSTTRKSKRTAKEPQKEQHIEVEINESSKKWNGSRIGMHIPNGKPSNKNARPNKFQIALVGLSSE